MQVLLVGHGRVHDGAAYTVAMLVFCSYNL